MKSKSIGCAVIGGMLNVMDAGAIRRALKQKKKPPKHGTGGLTMADLIERDDALKTVNAEFQAFRWIPCSERLPKKHETVLTCCYGSDVIIPQEGETLEDAVKRTRRELVTVSIGFIGSDGWYGADGWPNMVAPTFWMPLPNPPEAGADDA